MRRDYREKGQPQVMIIPMIVIMLFLLVFFMISTIYMVQLGTLQVSLPRAASAGQETRPNVVSVTVTKRGDVLYGKDAAPVSGESLSRRVREALEADGETVFVLQGDRSAPYEHVVQVLGLLKKSGARHVSIATEIRENTD